MSLFSTVVNAARRFESALRSRLEFKGSWRSPFNRPTKSRVLDIPFEIAQLLAEHLDDASARALCRTSKSLRVAGQLRFWRTLRVMVDIPPHEAPYCKDHHVTARHAAEDGSDREYDGGSWFRAMMLRVCGASLSFS
jgi:hypothetical protein